jgi:hypothetical protein
MEEFFKNIEACTPFERKRKLAEYTNNFDLNLLVEFSNEFVKYCWREFVKRHNCLPFGIIPDKEAGTVYLNEFEFPFYTFQRNKVNKEIHTEYFNENLDYLSFHSFMNTFLREIETILENKYGEIATTEFSFNPCITPKNKPANYYPLIFTSEVSYKCFLEYTKKHVIEFYSDYSYLKKRMEHERLIHKHTDNEFMEFLFKVLGLITEKNFEEYQCKHDNKLKSLGKSYSIQRENNFNIVFETLI